MSSELITVVIPAHDAEATVAEQVEAVLPQLGAADALIVVDNRSSDRTGPVAAAAAGADPRFRLVEAMERAGAAHARNVGAAAADTPLLAFCDADDVVAPGWLAALRAELALSDYVAGWIEADRLNPSEVVGIRGRQARELPSFLGRLAFAHGGNMGVRRAAWTLAGGMDDHPDLLTGEDIDFALRMLREGVRPTFRADAVVHARYRTDPTDLYRQALSHSRVIPLLVARMRGAGLGRPPVFLDARKWVWLVVRLPLLRTDEGRMRWRYQAGVRWGLLRGSLRHRTLVL